MEIRRDLKEMFYDMVVYSSFRDNLAGFSSYILWVTAMCYPIMDM